MVDRIVSIMENPDQAEILTKLRRLYDTIASEDDPELKAEMVQLYKKNLVKEIEAL